MHILWQIIGWAYLAFIIWMFFDCVYSEEDKVERLSWCIVMSIMLPLIAPVYFFRRHLPRRKEKKEAKG